MIISLLFADIERTAGITGKSVLMLHALQDAKLAPIITQIYQDTYDFQRKYGVHKFEIIDTAPTIRKSIESDYKDFHALLDKLANRELTGNAAVYAVGNTIGTFEPSDWPILRAILNKKLTIGLSKTTFFDAIVKERSLELGGEGVRKFDLIRWNLLAKKITDTNN